MNIRIKTTVLVAALLLGCQKSENENGSSTRSDDEKIVGSIEYADVKTGERSIDEFRYSDDNVLVGYAHRAESEPAGTEPIEYAERVITIPEKEGPDAMSQVSYKLDGKGVCVGYAYWDGMCPGSVSEVVYEYADGRLGGCSLSADGADCGGTFVWTDGNLTEIEYRDANGNCTVELVYGTRSNVSSTNMDLNWAVTGYVLGGSLLMPFVDKPWAPMLRLCAKSSSVSLVSRIVETRNGMQSFAADITWETDSDGVPTAAAVLVGDSGARLKFCYR